MDQANIKTALCWVAVESVGQMCSKLFIESFNEQVCFMMVASLIVSAKCVRF